MAFKLMQKVVDTLGIPVMQKAVLVVLARHSLEDGTNRKSPSVQTLADKAGMCAKAARVALRGLEEDGWIIALGNKAGGRKQTTRYLIVVGKFEPTETRHDVPGNEEETRHDVPPNGHDPEGKTRYDSPLNTVPRTAEEVLEEKVSKESVCDVGVNPREAHTQGPADSSETRKANVVPFVKPGRPEVLPLPEGWLLPDDWRAWAEEAGQSGIDVAAGRFFDFHFERGSRKTEAGWLHAWQRWIHENIERGYGNGQRHDYGRRAKSGNGLVAYAHAEMQRNPGFAEDHQDDGHWREL